MTPVDSDPDLTYGELHRTSVRVREEPPVKDFELALSELIQLYRGRIGRNNAAAALEYQHELVSTDSGWATEVAAPDPAEGDPKPEGDPEAA